MPQVRANPRPGRILKRLRNLARRFTAASVLRGTSAARYEIRLSSSDLNKIATLAKLRNESVEEAFRATVRNLIATVPAGVKERNLVQKLDF